MAAAVHRSRVFGAGRGLIRAARGLLVVALVSLCVITCFAGTIGWAAIPPPTARVAPSPHPVERNLEAFWSNFRRAVRERDKPALVGMAHFPFVVRWGDADPSDQKVELDQKDFVGKLDQLLLLGSNGQAVDAVSKDGTMVEGTMIEAIAKGTPHPIAHDDPGDVFLECFEFRLFGKQWKWTTVFSADASFFGTADAYPIPRVSPLRKHILDVMSESMKLSRPLVVSHLRTTGTAAYVEAQESGRRGRTARALLRRKGTDENGGVVWIVAKSSVREVGAGTDSWSNEINKMIKSGLPASLFPSKTDVSEEGGGYAH